MVDVYQIIDNSAPCRWIICCHPPVPDNLPPIWRQRSQRLHCTVFVVCCTLHCDVNCTVQNAIQCPANCTGLDCTLHCTIILKTALHIALPSLQTEWQLLIIAALDYIIQRMCDDKMNLTPAHSSTLYFNPVL